jgi:AAA15 family ATPase/GTPase
MLLRFRCKNFRSIREEQEISLIASKTRTEEKSESLIETPIEDLRLLRCAAIYGANASGKSNVLDAFAAFGRTVSDSWRAWKPNGPIPEFDPFLLDDTSKEGETHFELTFLLESQVYKYYFRFDRNKFNEELLIDVTGHDKVLFHRLLDGSGVRFPNKNLGKTQSDRRHLEGIEREVRPNSLFLSAAAQKAEPLLSKIYAALSDNFTPMHWKNMSGRQRYTAELCSNVEFRNQILKMVRFADAGISDIEASSREFPDSEKKTLKAVMAALRESDPEKFSGVSEETPELPSIPEVRMAHFGADGRQYTLNESKESDGTQAYFSALGPILRALKSGAVLLVDELESSLHPKLARELVEVFNSAELNPKGAQFVFTTHNTNLLDLGLLRRDQIWFTEKSRDGATRLYPLSDYQPRTNQNIEAGYLGGRFGAIPFLDEQLLRDSLLPSEPEQASLRFSSEA